MREIIAAGVGFTPIIEKKFTTTTVKVVFCVPLERESVSLNVIATDILTTNSKTYPTMADLTLKLAELYSANLSTSCQKVGDVQEIHITMTVIDDKFTFDNEKLSKAATEILLDCIFNPYVEENGFGKEIFGYVKQDILDEIESEINNKRPYILKQAMKEMFKGEPAAIANYGDKSSAEKATPQNTYEAYLKLLETAAVEIFTVSPEPIDIKKMFADAFSKIKRTPVDLKYISRSPLKEKVSEITEKIDVLQAKTVFGFKGHTENRYADKMFSTVLGELPSSKLFVNVREKMSLCYYCSAGFQYSKGVISIDSGVETENIEIARKAILEQIEEIQKGNISDYELTSAKLAIENNYNAINDAPNSIISWILFNYQFGEDTNSEKEIANYKKVTKEDIVKSANAFKLDTVYILRP